MEPLLKKLGVAAVYLFGSRAEKRAGPLSDYDVAVLLKDSLPQGKYFDARLRLISYFSTYFKHSNVEIIILNNAPPLLAMNVIDCGKILFDSDKAARISFETKTTMRYLDRLPYERRYLQTLLQSI